RLSRTFGGSYENGSTPLLLFHDISAGAEETDIFMKNRAILLWAALALSLLSSCVKEGSSLDNSSGRDSSISVNPSSLTLRQEGETQRVSVKASGKWVMNGSAPWLEVTPDTGDGDAFVAFTASENPDADERNATFSFICGDAIAKLTVVQNKNDVPTVTPEKDNIEVNGEGGEFDVKLQSNVNYTVEISDKTWIHQITKQSKAMTSSTLRFVADENATGDDRSGVIRIFAEGSDKVTTIKVSQPSIEVALSDGVYNIGPDGGTVDVNLNTNIPSYTLSISPAEASNWLWQISTKTLHSDRLSFNVATNYGHQSREAVVTIKSIMSGKSVSSFIIRQSYENVPGNVIIYTTKYDTPITLPVTKGFGANFISSQSTYENGKGKLVFDNDISTIPANAFKGLSVLTSVILPNSVTFIGESAFVSCSTLETVVLPSGLLEIGATAFCNSGLKFITIPLSVTTFGSSCFSTCHDLHTINFEAGSKLSAIPASCFNACVALKNMMIPANVTTIEMRAFRGCSSLETVEVENGGKLKEIEGYQSEGTYGQQRGAFADCIALKSVNLGSNLSSIGPYAFYNCNNLKSVTIMSYYAPSLPDVKYTPFSATGAVLNCQEDRECYFAEEGYWRYFPALPPVSDLSLSRKIGCTTADFELTMKSESDDVTLSAKLYYGQTQTGERLDTLKATKVLFKNGKCSLIGLQPNTCYSYRCVPTIIYKNRKFSWDSDGNFDFFLWTHYDNDGDNERVTEEDWKK
ncbi:MAG: leucine-rich repeat protein, partial [Bacteroidales bacterium]|nr:leucine-rich repeat protein [Bacteroidales bacterium]